MFRLAAAILLLTATTASAGTGGDFCEVLRKEHVACINEAMTRSGGAYLRKCPKAQTSLTEAYNVSIAKASGSLRSELDNANDLWKEISSSPLPAIGETPEAYIARGNAEGEKVNKLCKKLYGLDSN